MSREAWSLIKQNKNFNVHVYRRGLIALILSLGISGVLASLMFYFYAHQPEPDYYATSGITPPIQLKGLLAPNMTSQALLEPDPPTDDTPRVIPQ